MSDNEQMYEAAISPNTYEESLFKSAPDAEHNENIRKTTYDNVFKAVFKNPQNVLKLYQQLHPEDSNKTIDDILDQTLTTVFAAGFYNDLGFLVRDGKKYKFVILIEAQSRWDPNISFRLLVYLVYSYLKYLHEQGYSIHSGCILDLPQPDLYVIFTGNSKNVPSEISLKETYAFDDASPLELKVKILKNESSESISGQYIGFCKVYNEVRKRNGKMTKATIKEALDICEKKGYLVDLIKSHSVEVCNMMEHYFDADLDYKNYLNELKRDFKKEGKDEGKAEGIEIGEIKTYIKLINQGVLSIDFVLSQLGITLAQFKNLVSQPPYEGLLKNDI